jgi:hypothetical protein
MNKAIKNIFPNNWNLIISDGDSEIVSPTVRRQLNKLNLQQKRQKQSSQHKIHTQVDLARP